MTPPLAPAVAGPALRPSTARRRPRQPSGDVRLSLPWWRLIAALSLLAGAAAVVGLVAADRIYGRETDLLFDAAVAQDLATALLVAPVTALLGVQARRGSFAACLCLPGCLAFLAYNYAIYAFSLQFGPLFLLWVSLLGMSAFALAGTLAATDLAAVRRRFACRPMPGTATSLILVATLFALLWLSEVVPDLLAGGRSRSADDWQVPTNPVHVLDLALFLPAVVGSGVLLLRRHALGYATAAGQLVWMALTCVPILLTPAVASARGDTASWAVVLPIGGLLVALLVLLRHVLRCAAHQT